MADTETKKALSSCVCAVLFNRTRTRSSSRSLPPHLLLLVIICRRIAPISSPPPPPRVSACDGAAPTRCQRLSRGVLDAHQSSSYSVELDGGGVACQVADAVIADELVEAQVAVPEICLGVSNVVRTIPVLSQHQHHLIIPAFECRWVRIQSCVSGGAR